MTERQPADLDEVLLAVVRDEIDYPIHDEFWSGLDREHLLGASPEERSDTILNGDQVRELVSPDTAWCRTAIPVAALDDCYYPNDTPWPNFTDRTNLVRDGAHELKILDPVTRTRVLTTMDAVRDGDGFEPLVLMATSDEGPYVIVHGAERVTAFVRLLDAAREVPVFLGVSEGVGRWPWWPVTE